MMVMMMMISTSTSSPAVLSDFMPTALCFILSIELMDRRLAGSNERNDDDHDHDKEMMMNDDHDDDDWV